VLSSDHSLLHASIGNLSFWRPWFLAAAWYTLGLAYKFTVCNAFVQPPSPPLPSIASSLVKASWGHLLITARPSPLFTDLNLTFTFVLGFSFSLTHPSSHPRPSLERESDRAYNGRQSNIPSHFSITITPAVDTAVLRPTLRSPRRSYSIFC
jgi:hypothetical protein